MRIQDNFRSVGAKFSLPRYWFVVAACFLASNAAWASESIDIPLNQSSIDNKLIEVIRPPVESDDKVAVTEEGFLVSQSSDVAGIRSKGAGVGFPRVLNGDFSFELDFDIESLSRPTSGWGQGMNVRLVTEDSRMPIMSFGCVAMEKHERAVMIQLTRQVGFQKVVRVIPLEFTSGTWIVERTGRAIRLKVRKSDGETWESEAFTCPTADVVGLQVLCTRQERGNTEAKYKLKHIRVTASSFSVR